MPLFEKSYNNNLLNNGDHNNINTHRDTWTITIRRKATLAIYYAKSTRQVCDILKFKEMTNNRYVIVHVNDD